MNYSDIVNFINEFNTEEKCIEYLKKTVWGNKPCCPDCNRSDKIYDYRSRPIMKCGACGTQFSIRKGTIFESSRLPLAKWFYAIYLFTAHKKGISSCQLGRDLKVKQQTAWYMLHRIRQVMGNTNGNAEMDGIIEADETYIGGKESNKHLNKRTRGTQGRSTKTKAPVFGMVRRSENEKEGSVVKAYAVNKVNGKIVKSAIVKNVVNGAVIITDDFNAYNGIGSLYEHKQVNHSKKEYVKGIAHTNNIEGFWANLKRGVYGIYHHVSEKHLQRYIDEFSMRFNLRKMTDIKRFQLAISNIQGTLSYAEVIRK